MENIKLLIKTAQDLVALHGDGKNHTVAAAIMTQDNSVVLGLNLFHFNGGPCAELVALANTQANGKNPTILVAVGDKNRGVLAPCGRCRQVLADYYPDTNIVVMDSGEPVTKSISELLPYVYDWESQQA